MVTPETIKKLVEKEFNLDISSKKRLSHIVHARWVYFKLAREFTTCSLATIGKEALRDHATVLHGLKYIDSDMKLERFLHIHEAYEKIKNFLITGDNSPLRKNLVDLHEIKEHIRGLEDRISLLEYESKQNNLVKDQVKVGDVES